ncbi:conserved hypothetical protein [Ignisphaera aggregans DSM 17230]|uniref:Uncharacterized protein n=1 Tax=Ignisphaera aggregans (strain DSM 17230 / JCM 13409 / AQ1.S1) TaxID=583356 RepID=E0STR3_IGNAA|nr:conserved hypothetical protein [Ignisphaera aggregans DSM 17230]
MNSSLFERVSERLGIEEELLVKRALDAYISSKLREIELEEDHIMERYGVSSFEDFKKRFEQGELENVKRSVIEVEDDYFKLGSLSDSEEMRN